MKKCGHWSLPYMKYKIYWKCITDLNIKANVIKFLGHVREYLCNIRVKTLMGRHKNHTYKNKDYKLDFAKIKQSPHHKTVLRKCRG